MSLLPTSVIPSKSPEYFPIRDCFLQECQCHKKDKERQRNCFRLKERLRAHAKKIQHVIIDQILCGENAIKEIAESVDKVGYRL